MSENISVQKLMDYFEYRLREIDQTQRDITTGEEPLFPMIIVFLGEASKKGFVRIAENLFRLWPQYQKELRFLYMEHFISDSGAYELKFSECLFENDGKQKIIPVDENQVQKIVSYMFSPQNHFKNKRELKIYYILDTIAINDMQEYSVWMEAIDKSRNIFGLHSYELSELLLLLLDESVGREIAGKIKNAFAKCYDDEGFPVKSVFLLSNRRGDNAVCNDWHEHYHMMASLIALSNSGRSQAVTTMFSSGVKTISYAREEKPSDQIGQVVVTELLDYLNQNGGARKQSVEETFLLEQCGFTKERTIKVLDDFVESMIGSILPSCEQMEVFPRKSMKYVENAMEMFSDEFNEETMGAWNCYLEKEADALKEKIRNDKYITENVIKCYKNMIAENFSVGEMLYLAEKTDVVENLFARLPENSLKTKKVSEAAGEMLRYHLSADSEIREQFKNIFLTQCQNAKYFIEAWDYLSHTRREVFSLKDTTLEGFYKKRLRGYFDENRMVLMNVFNKLRGKEELWESLKKIIDDMIDSDGLYSAPFEEELATRLNGGEQQNAANQYIRQKLAEEDVYIYLQTNFGLPEPIFSTVMLKKGISLHDYLEDSLAEDTYYYDTGISKAAEAIKIYEISKENLIS